MKIIHAISEAFEEQGLKVIDAHFLLHDGELHVYLWSTMASTYMRVPQEVKGFCPEGRRVSAKLVYFLAIKDKAQWLYKISYLSVWRSFFGRPAS